MEKEIKLIKYEITPNERSWGTTWKTEVWDEFGNYSCVYEPSEINAMEYILEWWEGSEEREERNKIHSECMVKMFNNNKK